MVNHCVAYGCRKLSCPFDSLRFHRFPFKRPELLKLWVDAIRRDNWTPSENSRICSDHFKPTDYTAGAKREILKHTAIPSIFNFTNHLASKYITPKSKVLRIVEDKAVEEVHIKEIDIDSKCDKIEAQTQTKTQQRQNKEFLRRKQIRIMKQQIRLRDIKIFKMNNVIEVLQNCNITLQNLTEGLGTNRQQTKLLKQKIRRKDAKITEMKSTIAELHKRIKTMGSLTSILTNHFDGFPLELLLHERRNHQIPPSHRRYTVKMKEFAYNLYMNSPKAYHFMRNYLTIPDERTIRRWTAGVDSEREPPTTELVTELDELETVIETNEIEI